MRINGVTAACAALVLLGEPLVVSGQPASPELLFPSNNAVNVGTSPPLQVSVSEPGAGNLTVTFFGRPAPNPGADFMIAVMPDTQYYSAAMNGGTPAMFESQTDWIVSRRAASNIVYAAQLGDIVNYGDTNHNGTPDYNGEWLNATNALYRLENPATTGLAGGIPYGTVVGNHDQSPNGDALGTTTFYNRFFGAAHFAGRPYYGGHYGTTNDDHFDLFSASGLDFIALYFEYDTNPPPAKLSWGNSVLQTYSNRHAIVFSHYIGSATTPSTFSAQGAAIYTALRTNANLFFMCSGHVSGEGTRSDVFRGHTVYTLVSDYQSYTNGGDGYMRLYHFSPVNNVIRVFTYSPWLDQFETDGESQFTLLLPFSTPSSTPADFVALGTNSAVPSGGAATLVWPGLATNTQYQWYATVRDSLNHATTGPVWEFTTELTNTPPVLANRSVTLTGDAPTNLTFLATDVNGDLLTYVLDTLPTQGLLLDFDPANGTVTYCPEHAYRGADRFTYHAYDGQASSGVASMNLNIVAPPTNEDGLPSAWGAYYGISDPDADPDGDGANNLQEYYANTNPTNATSAFRILSTAVGTNGHCLLTWSSVGGTRYRVQFANGGAGGGLPAGTFADIDRSITNEMDASPEGAASTQSFTDDFIQTGGPPPHGARYYRVRVVWQ
jgi:hypothetical protein